MSEHVADVVRARRFELVDDGGIVRATLGVDSEGARSFRLYSDEGTIRIGLSLLPDGTATLNMNDSGGREAIIATVAAGDLTGFVLFDREHAHRIYVTVNDDMPRVVIMDEKGQAVWGGP